MKLPAVAIAAAFAGGILLSRSTYFVAHFTLRSAIIFSLLCILAMLIASSLLIAYQKLLGAAMLSLLCWAALGVCAGLLSQTPLPPEHILQRMAAQQVDLHAPLRWHGRLRSEPTRLPWGYALDMELSGVDQPEGLLPIVGGLRLGYSPKDADDLLPDVHTGDQITALAQARLPQIYRDAGAFDRRAYLAEQNIHLQATLRAASLLEKVSSPRRSAGIRLA